MSDPSASKALGLPQDTDPAMSKSPPPAYSEVSKESGNSQSGPPSMVYPAPPAPDQGYPQPPYNQPCMQGYQYPPGQAPPDSGKNPEMINSPYPPGQYPPQGQYLPPGQYPATGQCSQGQYPQGPPVYSQGQPFPPGAYPQGPYPQGPYTQVPYGHPTTAVVVTQPSGATVLVAQSPPPDNMILSWLACLFCFCPIGIFAVIHSWQAKCANDSNDFQTAAKYGNKARRLSIASIVFGILIFIICIILRLIIYTSDTTASY